MIIVGDLVHDKASVVAVTALLDRLQVVAGCEPHRRRWFAAEVPGVHSTKPVLDSAGIFTLG
ncbi:MAG: hypothetical protein ABJB32_00425 [Verrucomicrobiota bacterium]